MVMIFLVICIPLIVFGTQFAQILTIVHLIRVWMEEVALMELTTLRVPVLLATKEIRVTQVSYTF